MDTTPAPAPHTLKSTAEPKDFFLWLGLIIALYGSITSLLTLLFQYINYAFPDELAGYADPYNGSIRFAMATLIVLAPTVVVLARLIRSSIEEDPSKATLWIRRWALVLTLFVASATVVIDLITLVNTFLGGEITERFVLKVVVVLLAAVGVFLHFLADLKGYWILNPKKANTIGIAFGVLALATIVSGFLIIGSPTTARLMRFDAQKVSDLQSIQYQVLNSWQQHQILPTTLSELADPLSGFTLPVDPQTGNTYEYRVVSPLSFELCATFNAPAPDTKGMGTYPATDSYVSGGFDNPTFMHETGRTCYTRTIDPVRYPPYPKAI